MWWPDRSFGFHAPGTKRRPNRQRTNHFHKKASSSRRGFFMKRGMASEASPQTPKRSFEIIRPGRAPNRSARLSSTNRPQSRLSGLRPVKGFFRRLNRFKHFFTFLAKRAYPIFGQIFESRSGFNAVIGIAYFGIVYISAYFAFVLFHNFRIFKNHCVISCGDTLAIGVLRCKKHTGLQPLTEPQVRLRKSTPRYKSGEKVCAIPLLHSQRHPILR